MRDERVVRRDPERVVVAEADQVERSGHLGDLDQATARDVEQPVAHRPDPGPPDHLVDQLGVGPRRRGPPLVLAGSRREHRHEAVDRAGGLVPRAQDPPRLVLGQQHRLECFREPLRVPASRRDRAEEPPEHRVGHRFVDRHPAVDQVAEGLPDPVDVSGPRAGPTSRFEEAALVLAEPAGQVEVVQADPHRDAGVAGRGQHRSVVLDRCRVVATGMRFEPGPVERQTVVGQAELGELGEVLLVAHPEPVAVPRSGGATGCLPRVPVAARRRSLGLQRRRTGPPHEPVGEAVAPSGSGRRLCRHVRSCPAVRLAAGLSAACSGSEGA